MPEKGGGHGHESHSAQNTVGEIKPIKMLYDVLNKTIDGIVDPIVELPLKIVEEDFRGVAQGATNLGAQPAKGGGKSHAAKTH